MNIDWALFYGFIQGVSEFLPVSSSGHLALIPYFFELKDPGVFFDLVMHLGTAIAVIIYFHKEVRRVILEAYLFIIKRDLRGSIFFQNFFISTFFSFLLILVLKGFAFDFGRMPLLIGVNFIVFGILMYLSDRCQSSLLDLTKEKKNLHASLIGIGQALAVFPGVSRSGITLTIARSLKLSRLQASRYSFLLSLPVIIGSIIFKLPEIINGNSLGVDGVVILVGVLSSFFFGIITIHFFLKLIARIGLLYFAIYRVAIGALLIYMSLS